MAMNEAARKRLGLQIGDIVTGAYTSNGFVSRNEYLMFWNQVYSPIGSTSNKPAIREATNFLDAICSRLLCNLDPSYKPSGGPNEQKVQPNEQMIDPLANTIAFVVTQMEFNGSDPRLKKHLEAFQKLETSLTKNTSLSPSFKEPIRFMSLKDEIKTVIDALVVTCCTFHSAGDYQRYSDLVKVASIDEADIKNPEACFGYDFIRKACRLENKEAKDPKDSKRWNDVIDKIKLKMQTVTQQIKISPNVAGSCLTGLLHLLRQILPLNPCIEANIAKNISTAISQFYLWPNPYGLMTKDLLQALHQEIISPGTCCRERAVRDAVGPEYMLKIENPTFDPQAELLPYFIDTSHALSSCFAYALGLSAYEPSQGKRQQLAELAETNLISHTIQANIILNAFAAEPSVGAGDVEVEQIKTISPAQLAELYDSVQKLCRELNSRETRAEKLAEEKKKLANYAQAAEGGVQIYGKLAFPFFVEPPKVAHTIIPSKTHTECMTKDELAAAHFSEPVYPSAPCIDGLRSLLTSYTNNHVDTPLVLRIVIAGNDESLHAFTCAYARLRQTEPHLFQGLEIRFLILPFGRNSLSAFLARHDFWYFRFLYTPFRTPLFALPFVRPQEGDNMEEKKQFFNESDIGAPGLFLRNCVEQYAREAENVLPINMYRLEGWLNSSLVKSSSSSAAQPDHVVPFLQRVELGVLPAAARARRPVQEAKQSAKALWSDPVTEVEAIANSKDFDFVPPEVIVKFTKMDYSGKQQQSYTEESSFYYSISINNVPKKNDFAYPADPCAPFLELSARLHKNYKKETTGKSLLPNEPKQRVCEVEISCLQANQNFSVMIDGMTYGPYGKVRISPLYDAPVTPNAPSTSSSLSTPSPLPSSSSSSSLAPELHKPAQFLVQTFFPTSDLWGCI